MDQEYQYEKQYYSLSEIARIINRPRSTLKEWADLFREYLPKEGVGRSARYRKEALDIFKLIEEMKEHNEPNEAIRRQLAHVVQEVVIYEDEEKKDVPYVVDVLQDVQKMKEIFQDMLEVVEDIKEQNDELKEQNLVLAKQNLQLQEQIEKMLTSQEKQRELLVEQMNEMKEQQKEWATMTQEEIREFKRIYESQKADNEKKGLFSRLFGK